jgi:hypothetical protein
MGVGRQMEVTAVEPNRKAIFVELLVVDARAATVRCLFAHTKVLHKLTSEHIQMPEETEKVTHLEGDDNEDGGEEGHEGQAEPVCVQPAGVGATRTQHKQVPRGSKGLKSAGGGVG